VDQKLKGFFDTAQKTAGETTAAQNAAADAAAERARILAENRKALRQQIDEELTPILDILAGLPEKDGKRFSTSIEQRGFDSEVQARYGVTVSYRNPSEERYHDHSKYDRPRPEVWMEIIRQPNGALDFHITQYSIIEGRINNDYPKHKRARATDFEAARQELGIGLGTFAADRMAEIGEKLGAMQASAPVTAATACDDDAVAVFAKPLQFKNTTRIIGGGAEIPTIVKEADAPAQPIIASGGAPVTEKKKRFWQRWGFG
jgi:hypothetical protein